MQKHDAPVHHQKHHSCPPRHRLPGIIWPVSRSTSSRRPHGFHHWRSWSFYRSPEREQICSASSGLVASQPCLVSLFDSALKELIALCAPLLRSWAVAVSPDMLVEVSKPGVSDRGYRYTHLTSSHRLRGRFQLSLRCRRSHSRPASRDDARPVATAKHIRFLAYADILQRNYLLTG